ncbi:MAG: hypothetical protein AB7U26_00670 [Sulfuricurvum sp.]
MPTNIEKYRDDLNKLVNEGKRLELALQYECFPDHIKDLFDDPSKLDEFIKNIPNFRKKFQSWYSESKVLIKQLLPDRLEDFVRHYEKPKSRKDITYENYRIEDYLQSLTVTRGYAKTIIVGPEAAIPHFTQQVSILEAVSKRFESSLFDIKQFVQADLFDSELDAARELIKHGFLRGAGAICGVVLEKHLSQVAENHNISIRKKHPTISDLNELLKTSDILDVPSWRQIQRLGDIRNLCDHNKDREPIKDELEELVAGVEKFTKTLF